MNTLHEPYDAVPGSNNIGLVGGKCGDIKYVDFVSVKLCFSFSPSDVKNKKWPKNNGTLNIYR